MGKFHVKINCSSSQLLLLRSLATHFRFLILGHCQFSSANLHFRALERQFSALAWLANFAVYQHIFRLPSFVVNFRPAFEQQIQQDAHSQVRLLPHFPLVLHGRSSLDRLHSYLSHLSGEFGALLDRVAFTHLAFGITSRGTHFTPR